MTFHLSGLPGNTKSKSFSQCDSNADTNPDSDTNSNPDTHAYSNPNADSRHTRKRGHQPGLWRGRLHNTWLFNV